MEQRVNRISLCLTPFKTRVIPTFGIRIKESLGELDFDPDIIAKFEFPETPPWTYPTVMVNLTLSYAKKG